MVNNPFSGNIPTSTYKQEKACVCLCFVDRFLSFCTFAFGNCIVCSSIYGFWIPLCYIQTLVTFYNLYAILGIVPDSTISSMASVLKEIGTAYPPLTPESCDQCRQCLWIVHSWLPLPFSLTFICLVSCVPNDASANVLLILDCPISFL